MRGPARQSGSGQSTHGASRCADGCTGRRQRPPDATIPWLACGLLAAWAIADAAPSPLAGAAPLPPASSAPSSATSSGSTPVTPSPAPPSPRSPASGFMRVRGHELVVDGKPLRFVGANLAVIHGEAFRARFRQTMQAAARDGLRVGRVWALGEGPADAPEWLRRENLFRAGPDGWREEMYLHLDHVLAEARRLGLRLILTLANHWPDYGGIPQYLAWAGHPGGSSFGAADRFYSDSRCRAWFREHLRRLATRRNQVTGVLYRDDPTILAWELVNESSVESEAGAAARLQWIEEMAAFIRSLDGNHLITPGVLGYDRLRARQQWLAACRLPGVDYCDAHIYPQDGMPIRDAEDLAYRLDDLVHLAHSVAGKPLVVGEFGFHKRSAPWNGRSPASWTRLLLDRLRLDGGSGALIWVYQPYLGEEREYGIFVDRASSEPMRSVLRQAAVLAGLSPPEVSNPRLASAQGEQPLYQPWATVRHRRQVHDGWGRASDGVLTLALAPQSWSEARWERLGFWDRSDLAHVYGADSGYFEYAFAGPGRAPARLLLRARLSSEFPGARAPADGGSRVELSLDGLPLGVIEAAPDDGLGRWEQLEVTDAGVLARLGKGRHRLRLTVATGPRANGLCVYGRQTEQATGSHADAGPMEILLWPAAPPPEARRMPPSGLGSGAPAGPGSGPRPVPK